MAADPHELAALRPKLLRYARSLTRNAETAEDLTQTTLCRTFTRAHLYEPTAPLLSWALKILHNEYVNWVRSSVRRATVEIGAAIDARAVDNPEIEAYASEIVALLGQLSEEKQVVVKLATVGYSYDEIADLTQAPIGTIRSRLSRGREELRTERPARVYHR